MNKKWLLAFALGLLLTLSGYAQSESKGNYFFSVGAYDGIFSDGPIVPFANFKIKKLIAGTVGGYYELPYGPGNAFFGLEAGYSSGSKFGGSGGVDFIPLDLTAAYVFPLTSFFYLGPRLKLGALGLLGPDWNKAVLTAGARLDAELRSKNFPLGLFVAGGIDLFPTAPELALLPVIEAGIRFPRGKFTWPSFSNTEKNKEPATAAPAPVVPAPVVTAPVAPTPVVPTPVVPAPVAPPPVTPAPVVPAAPAPAIPAPVAPTPVVPAPVVPTPVVPAPVVPAPVVPAPVVPAPVVPAPVVPAPVIPTPVIPVPIVPTPVPPAPVVPPPVVPAPVVPAPVIPAPVAPAPVVPPPVLSGIQGRNIVLENGRQGILNSIYFEPDTDVLIETYRPILEMVGRYLAADPGLKLLIRAYAADFGTSGGRYIVSVSRARFSKDFLTEKYGISSSRFSTEAYGADKSPIYVTDDWQSHRCVELILFKE